MLEKVSYWALLEGKSPNKPYILWDSIKVVWNYEQDHRIFSQAHKKIHDFHGIQKDCTLQKTIKTNKKISWKCSLKNPEKSPALWKATFISAIFF
jgi:hypothetical protein